MPEQATPQDLQTELAALESTALSFGFRFIPDAAVRSEYNSRARALSQELQQLVNAGKITPAEGAQRASTMRNVLMDAMRGKTSEIAQAYAIQQKAVGKSLLQLEAKYSLSAFGKSFDTLSPAHKNQVWKEIVFSSGRPQTRATQLAKIMGVAGKGFIALTITVSVYNIYTADDVLKASAKEGAVLGGGLLGSVAGGAAAGLMCGPGAPVCVGIGIFVGGVMFTVGSEIAFDSFWN